MARRPRQAPFWNREAPPRRRDLKYLRPSPLPKGKRFETKADVLEEGHRSEQVLGKCEQSRTLAECSANTIDCCKPYCPKCARAFRRWFAGELLRITEVDQRPMHIMTVLLKSSERDDICQLDPKAFRHLLRKRIQRSPLAGACIVGGFEVVYRARDSKWILHINLLVIGPKPAALNEFQKQFKSSFSRPILVAQLKDPAEQLSYVLKFTTYHRPFEQTGPRKASARPLNRSEHSALVRWMHQRRFQDFLFLFNAVRRGATIALRPS
jgi:hypothetical protein